MAGSQKVRLLRYSCAGPNSNSLLSRDGQHPVSSKYLSVSSTVLYFGTVQYSSVDCSVILESGGIRFDSSFSHSSSFDLVEITMNIPSQVRYRNWSMNGSWYLRITAMPFLSSQRTATN